MIRFVAALLVGLLVLVDVAPAFAQSDDTIIVAQETRRRTLFDLLFGEPEPPPPPVQKQRPRRQAAPEASLPPPAPKVEKALDATRLAVFGDSLAVDLSKALERFYADDPNLVVINQGVGSSGLVRDDYFDWNKAIDEQIAADSFDIAVVIIGINDRPVSKFDDLISYLSRESTVGDTVVLTILRDGDTLQIDVTLEARPR